ncbi:SHOCT domain-containing protein [Terrisporobacter glycolicus]|uniref:SHOCT domain-containing protein n=1 Tax=Terrisporobacter glycolicus ATCC 14880 = DSM 1288 TaxID=1121315 RepID=A0ABZ2EWE0_9FIRM|nr:SHOCT domain-containing protein [Terrisporobacter glycolicus]
MLGWIIIIFGLYKIIGDANFGGGLIIIVFGIFCLARENDIEETKKESTIDRSKDILDEIGGYNNIDINLSKYCDEGQLIVLKNKKVCIGWNNFETKKLIDFNSIVKLEIKVNNITIGNTNDGSRREFKEIIESINVYIHTNESTEELVFKYLAYDIDESQENYNEILKGLKRFEIMLEDTSHLDSSDRTNNININENSVPKQIKEYKELLDMNAITLEEFEMKKKELLNN